MKTEQKRRKPAQSSVSQKYTRGYLLLLIMLIVTVTASFIVQTVVSREYAGLLDDLTELNELFVSVDATNRRLLDYYMNMDSRGRAEFSEQREALLKHIDTVQRQLQENWSRDMADLCFTAQTYAQQSDRLVAMMLGVKMEGAYADIYAGQTRRAYADCQETISFINQSFKDIYTVRLDATKAQQARMRRANNWISAGQVCLALAACMVCVRYYRLILRDVKQSLDTLTAFASRAKERLIPLAHVTLETKDEFSVFADAFNSMLDTIQEQMRHIEESSHIREQLQQAEMENLRMSNTLQTTEMRLLQSRINPHFLFNTLSNISAVAQAEGAERSVELIATTASYLRYNLDRLTKAVTLEEELENAHNYVDIQKSRFGEQFLFTFTTDARCAGAIMPCMILQPLIENAIQHGIRDLPKGGTVHVGTSLAEGRAHILVEDNGRGFDPSTLTAIEAKLATSPLTESSAHVGLRNIYQRLMLYFAGDVGFTIQSEPGCTRVMVSLPFSPAQE